MAFVLEDYIPKPNPWLETEVKYEGIGHAEFLNPKGWIEGPITIQFNEFGKSIVEMTIEEIENEQALGSEFHPHDLMWLVHGRKPDVRGDSFLGGVTGKVDNVCSKLSATINNGTFEVAGDIYYSELFDFNRVRFSPLVSQFTYSNVKRAKYWVLPLSNFVAMPFLYHPIEGSHPLFRHPLRIYHTPIVSDDLPPEQKQKAYRCANRRNSLIVFKFRRGLAFIEPLSDFEERRKKLENGQAFNLITAVMVGRVGDKSLDPRNLDYEHAKDWLPLEFIHFLSLATGTLVGIPWIEFRDRDGNLVRRIHTETSLWQSPYQKGHAAVDVRQFGSLLTNAPKEIHPSLRVAIRYAVKGSRNGLGNEDNFSHLVRAIDSLCENVKSSTASLNLLDPQRKKSIKEIVTNAHAAISKIAVQAELEGNITEAQLIRRVVDQRVQSVLNPNKKIGFDEAIYALLQTAGLQDARLMEQFYNQNPRSDDAVTLPQVISLYRERAIHENYFVFSDGTHDLKDVMIVHRHLHDILLRVILKMINYNGEYDTPLFPGSVSLDWVTLNTPVNKLGY